MDLRARAPPGMAARADGMLMRVVLTLVCLLCVAMIAAPAASAAPPTPDGTFDGSATSAGSFAGFLKVAVDEATGDVYVLDQEHDSVARFSSTGTFISEIRGSDTTATTFTFAPNSYNDIAVDNTGGSGQGDVYVVSFVSSTIFKLDFDPTPSEVWEAPGILNLPCGIGVRADGSLWVTEINNTVVTELSPTDGTPTGNTIPLQTDRHCDIAFDNDDAMYLTGANEGFEKYDSEGDVIAFDSGPFPTYAVATSFSRNDIFSVGDPAANPTIQQWNKSGGSISEIVGSPGGNSFHGVALDGVRDRLYVADPAAAVVRMYDVPAQPPTVTARATTDITQTSATLHAGVNPNGDDVTDCHAEWVTEEQFQASGYAGAGTAPCSPAAPISGTDDVEVTAEATGLTPGTDYRGRIVATNGGGTTNGTDVLSITRDPDPPRPPIVTTGAATNVTQTGATLNGTADPNGAATSCEFQYGTSTGYGSRIAAASPGSGSGAVAVNATIGGLSPNTEYHFRLVCTNAGGATNGSDVTFRTITSNPPPPPPRTCLTDPTLCIANLALSGNPVARVRGSIASVGIRCTGDAGGVCRGTLTFRARIKVRVKRGRRTVIRRKTITIGRATFDLAVGGTSTLRISLTSAAKRARKKSALSATADGLDGAVKIPKAKARRRRHRRR